MIQDNCRDVAAGRASRRRLRAVLLAGVLATVAWAAAPLGGQTATPRTPPAGEKAEPTQEQPIFRTGASLVRVDAFVTDRGRAVTDLTADDFEVLEDGKPQTITSFEHVMVRGQTSDEVREPRSAAESREIAREARARVFVLFLDTYHVEVENAHRIRQPLERLLDRVLGPDDLVAVMTPEMSPRDITFARKTSTIAGMLDQYWAWARRDSIALTDPEFAREEQCFGTEVAEQIQERRRERRTLESLALLVPYLGALREERKAVVTVSDGWRLYRPDPSLTRAGSGSNVGVTPVTVGPDGRLGATPRPGERDASGCGTELAAASMTDNERYFLDMLQDANRANVSFYPVDPRGLPVFDSSMRRPLPPSVDGRILGARIDNLRTLATQTDGLAIVNSNDIEGGLRRMAEDLTSYYLMGYYSTNPALDGKFRTIKVRVKRPGLEVRARRGYRASSVDAAPPTAGAPTGTPTSADAPSTVVTQALTTLGTIRPTAVVRLTAAALVPRVVVDGSSVPVGGEIWVAGELDAAAARGEWSGGGEVTVQIAGLPASAVSGRADVASGDRTFVVHLTGVPAGDHTLQLRLRPSTGGLPSSEALRVAVQPLEHGIGTPFFRRRVGGPAQPFHPAGDRRFRRNETLRVEWPVVEAPPGGPPVVLDRNGRAMALPVKSADRTDDDGRTWRGAELSLSALAAGDYVLALPGAEVAAAFRVVQ
ncbi:MAG: VWA domain-containing protein [Vicinamibacterales bacterium]